MKCQSQNRFSDYQSMNKIEKSQSISLRDLQHFWLIFLWNDLINDNQKGKILNFKNHLLNQHYRIMEANLQIYQSLCRANLQTVKNFIFSVNSIDILFFNF